MVESLSTAVPTTSTINVGSSAPVASTAVNLKEDHDDDDEDLLGDGGDDEKEESKNSNPNLLLNPPLPFRPLPQKMKSRFHVNHLRRQN